jgi:hypothetical protein
MINKYSRKSRKSKNLLKKNIRGGGNNQSKRRKKPNLPPLKFSSKEYTDMMAPKEFLKKNSVKYSLQHMQKNQIDKIYNDIRKESLDFTFDCKVLASVHGRDMVKITSINSKDLKDDLVFYRSSGVSRLNSSIKDIWFPCGRTCISPISKRITKAENKYLMNNNILSLQVDKEDNSYKPTNNSVHLSKYGRFINKNYAIISKMLGEGFVCKS